MRKNTTILQTARDYAGELIRDVSTEVNLYWTDQQLPCKLIWGIIFFQEGDLLLL